MSMIKSKACRSKFSFERAFVKKTDGSPGLHYEILFQKSGRVASECIFTELVGEGTAIRYFT